MAGSSELSDALNPHYSTTRRPPIGTPTSQNAIANGNGHLDPTYLPSPTSQQLHVPNIRTNFTNDQQDAFLISPLTPSTTLADSPSLNPSQIPRQKPRLDPVQALRSIMMTLASQKHAFEMERQRRLEWEAQKEARDAEREAEYKSRIASLEKQIDDLKSLVVPASEGLGPSPTLQVSQPSPLSNGHSVGPENASPGNLHDLKGTPRLSESSVASATPEFVEGSSSQQSSAVAEDTASRKRTGSPSLESAMPASVKQRTRVHSHNQPKTIQAAVRNHILKCMALDSDRDLPPSFTEGQTLTEDQPVRFVWERTTRKSAHNCDMKKRIVSDIMMNKALYPKVPEQDFNKDKLDTVFEQSFTTLRSKFSSRFDKEDTKAQKARRQGRKKTKLGNRSETRILIPEYSGPFFDAAFRMECMSSEESSEGEDDEANASDEDRPKGYLKIRWLAWRSSRLQNLYDIVDEREELERSQKPFRGLGRKNRRLGQPKEGNVLPPAGVSKWMVSKKWYRESQARNAHVASIVKGAILEDEENAWMSLAPLGPESDYEDNPRPSMMMQTPSGFGDPYYGPSNWSEGLGFVGMNMLPPSV